ncbi:MAG: hypothetical protein PUE15_10890 [Prevotella sp.]|nr:hypothetical protein [Prevotella sp.]
MRKFTSSQCENCISYDHIKCSCREESSPLFGGNISPLHLACCRFISLSKVHARKNRIKKWFKVRTMDDMSDSRARLY